VLNSSAQSYGEGAKFECDELRRNWKNSRPPNFLEKIICPLNSMDERRGIMYYFQNME